MTGKLDLLWISARNKISNFLEDFKSEETGAAEIVAIILIICVVVGIAAVFREQISDLVNGVFGQATDFVNEK